jgi:23S rRNA (cytidine1920-2'-O)/16S rRNA (cytidine1409-2'-O)-methyltransferase
MSRIRKRPLAELLSMQYPEYDRERLLAFIACRNVKVDAHVCTDPKANFNEDAHVNLVFDQYVSRGGFKLAHALDAWHVSVQDLVMLDAGASTGGFTDCLLQRGARLVHAVDVGYNQLDWTLRTDARVVVHERQNIMTLQSLDPIPVAAVADLSFRSIRNAARHLFELISGPWAICLVKPQFEVDKALAGFTGVVTDTAVLRDTLLGVHATLESEGIGLRDVVESPIRGRKGNREFLALLSRQPVLDHDGFAQLVERLLTVSEHLPQE